MLAPYSRRRQLVSQGRDHVNSQEDQDRDHDRDDRDVLDRREADEAASALGVAAGLSS
jgi:hypothetical protein